MIRRTAILLYAACAYALAMLNITYIVGFLADFGVPKSVNDGVVGPLWSSVLIDFALILLFGLHHSATARLSFKRLCARWLPAEMERPTYLYMTALATGALVWFWQPVPVTLWQVRDPLIAGVIVAFYLGVLTMMVAATFHFGHFGFFGLADAWNSFRGRVAREGGFCSRWLYGLVRHPISLGWMLAPWLTPHLTLGQLVFALGTLVYILAATPFEERDLVELLGDRYRRYREDVPAFLPRFRRRKPVAAE